MSDATTDAKTFEKSLTTGQVESSSQALLQDLDKKSSTLTEAEKNAYINKYAQQLEDDGVLPKISEEWLSKNLTDPNKKLDTNDDKVVDGDDLRKASEDVNRPLIERKMLSILADRYESLRTQTVEPKDTNDKQISKADIDARVQQNKVDEPWNASRNKDGNVERITIDKKQYVYEYTEGKSGWYLADENGKPSGSKTDITGVAVDTDGNAKITYNGTTEEFGQKLDAANEKSYDLQFRKNGDVIQRNYKGEVTEVVIDGKKYINEGDKWLDSEKKPTDISKIEQIGSKVVVIREGKTTERFGDGTRVDTTKSADGTERKITTDKDGNVTAVKAEGIDAKWEGKQWNPPDIKHVQQDEDGTIRVIYNQPVGAYKEFKPGTAAVDGKDYRSIDGDATKDANVSKLKVNKGEGYYQTAERMLKEYGVAATPKQVLALARYMRDQVFAGRTSLKQGENLITAENLKKIREQAERIVNGKNN